MDASQWQVDRLDLDAYLARIGYTGPLEQSASVLSDIHRAHAASIPFENLDIALGRSPVLDLEVLQDKLVRHERGGYCYEHNLLFAAVLERLGFQVTRLAARVGQRESPWPRTHMLLRVDIDDERWLADVGFGAGLRQPMPLYDGSTAPQGGWTYRIDADETYGWRLSSRTQNSDFDDLCLFDLEPQNLIDYVMSNHFTSTHPSSPFVGQVVAKSAEADVRHTLRGSRLTDSYADGREETQEVDPEALVAVLRSTFGITLAPDEAKRLGGVAASTAA